MPLYDVMDVSDDDERRRIAAAMAAATFYAGEKVNIFAVVRAASALEKYIKTGDVR